MLSKEKVEDIISKLEYYAKDSRLSWSPTAAKYMERAVDLIKEDRKLIQHLLGPYPFIAGNSGEHLGNGLYEYFLVCPEFGADYLVTYKIEKDR